MPNADYAASPPDSQRALQLANQLWGWLGSGDGRIAWKAKAKKKVFDDLKDDAQTAWNLAGGPLLRPDAMQAGSSGTGVFDDLKLEAIHAFAWDLGLSCLPVLSQLSGVARLISSGYDVYKARSTRLGIDHQLAQAELSGLGHIAGAALLQCAVDRCQIEKRRFGTYTGGALAAFLDAIDEMTQQVMPHAYDQHPGLSVLIGRPLALVRASVGLELLGPPAADQSRAAFSSWAASGVHADRGVTKLAFPVRRGHKGHLNDGLSGYFIDPPDHPDQTYTRFFVEDHLGPDDHGVQDPAFEQLTVCAATGADGQVAQRLLTLLIDPRAPIHASTGILPVKQIELPASMFASAIGRMAVTFPVTPMLAPRWRSDADAIRLPVPGEPGYQWSFLRRALEPPGWPESAVTPFIVQAGFSDHPQQLIDGWLQLRPLPDSAPPDATTMDARSAGSPP